MPMKKSEMLTSQEDGMTKLSALVRCFCDKYPHESELSNARLTKMIYLADWKSAQRRGCQISDISWVFNHYGPYVDDVQYEAQRDPQIEVFNTSTMYGTRKVQIRLKGEADYSVLNTDDVNIVDEVIEDTKMKFWNDFIKYVYATYPIKANTRYARLDLIELAEKERVEISDIEN